MNKFLQHLLLHERFEIQTKLSKKEIIDRVSSFIDPKYTDYYGSVSDNEFLIAQKSRKQFAVGYTHNSFAPVAKARIEEKDGYCLISGIMRMNILVSVLFAPFYLISLLLVVPFPLMLFLLHFAFVKPAKRLKESIEALMA